MGTHMAHQFACQGTAACVMFVTFDRDYDTRWERPLIRNSANKDGCGFSRGAMPPRTSHPAPGASRPLPRRGAGRRWYRSLHGV
jgi:hypothetical protein